MAVVASLLIAAGVIIGAAFAVLVTIAAVADILPPSRAAEEMRGERPAPTAQNRMPARIGMKSQ
jgi:large-conductance mechanosensitive channel